MSVNNAHDLTVQREATQLATLNKLLTEKFSLNTLSDLQQLPVVRKNELLESQAQTPPFGTRTPHNVGNIFQSPGPLYEPGGTSADWWRFGRFLKAIGVNSSDIVLNTFSYHFTPAGAMFESAARANDAVVFPAGPGQSNEQAQVAAAIGATTYAGTPDFLATILEKADSLGLDVSRVNKAVVSAGPLFPQLREQYAQQGILCRQCYGTADVGLIAYETAECIDGMIIDDDVIVEIVTPGTGNTVADGEIGEVVVTVLNADYPLFRFSVGDLSAIMTDPSPTGCGRPRLVGWRGRADQAAKVRGMFIRPEQVARIVDQHDQIDRARVEISLDGNADQIEVKVEARTSDAAALQPSITEILKLNAKVVLVDEGQLPRDGVLVSDLRPVLSD